MIRKILFLLFFALLTVSCCAIDKQLEKGEIQLKLTKSFLNIKTSADTKQLRLTLKVNQKSLGEYTLNLRHARCDYAYINLGDFIGEDVDLTVAGLKRDLDALILDYLPKGNKPVRMYSKIASQAFEPNGVKMLYTPSEGKMWDPSLLWHDGYYYIYAMHRDNNQKLSHPNAKNYNGAEWYGMWGARSKDGVHWEDLGPVIKDCSFKVWKMFVMHNGEHFIAAHGSCSEKPGHENDTQCHWKSYDGVNWEYLGKDTDTHPDPRWYKIERRWDCMYMLPKEDGSGWMGYTVANLLGNNTGAIGRLESDDGIHWKVLPPVKFDWEGVGSGFAEFVGIEKMGDRYYTICGKRFGQYGLPLYSVYTFVSDSPDGPFRPDRKAFRYCGGSGVSIPSQWLAAMGRGRNNEILTTNYVGSKGWGPDVTLLPIKKAVIDKDGHLRPGYWKNNDAAKGDEIKIPSVCRIESISKRKIEILSEKFDFQKGLIIEGRVKAKPLPKGCQDSFAGFYLDHKRDNQGAGSLMGIGQPQERKSYIGLLRNIDEFSVFDPVDDIAGTESFRRAGLGVANMTGISDSKTHEFRLWIRQGLIELYIDDIVMQTFFTGPTNGKVGFIAENAEVMFSNVHCWQMNLNN